METTPDRALIYAIIQGGINAFQTAKNAGVMSDYLLDLDDRKIYEACEKIFLPKGRMPNFTDIRQNLQIEIPEPDGMFDPELCSKDIVKRALITKLNAGLAPIEKLVPKDPFKAREDLGQLVKDTNWSQGQVVRTNASLPFEEIEKRYKEAKARDGGLLGFSSPWKSRDARSLGLQPGEVTVLLAKRKTGKSWLLLKWAEHIWTAKHANGEPELKPGENILIVSMEMPIFQVLRRFFAIHKKLDYEKFRAGKLDPLDETRFLDWCEAMKKPDPSRSEVIFVASDKIRTVDDIMGMAAQYRPKAIFIDSFYILTRPDKRMQMWERMLENIKEIKLNLAVGFNIPVVTTTQLSGQVKRGDLNAEADAVSFAKAIGDFADSIDGIFGNDKFRDSNKRILRGMEAREFRTIDLEINFNPATHDYSEIRVLDKVEEGDGKSLDDAGDGGDAGDVDPDSMFLDSDV